MLGFTFSSKLDWGSYTICIAKTASKKIGALIRVLWSFFLLRLLCISIILPYAYVWNTAVRAGAPSCYLEFLDKLQKRIYRNVGPSLAASLEPLAHCQTVASLSLL